MNKQPADLQADDVLYENSFQKIAMINSNYPFTFMKCNGVVTLPYDEEGNIYILNKERPNIGTYLELPRGGLEEGETYIDGASRELTEETGLTILEIHDMGEIQPDTGLLKHKIHLVGCKVKHTEDYRFNHEDTVDKCTNDVRRMELKTLMEIVSTNHIVDGYTLSGLCKFLAYKENNKLK